MQRRRSKSRRAVGNVNRSGRCLDGSTRWHLSPPVIVVLLLLAIVASACNEIRAEPITFDNQSDQTIVIFRVFATSESVKMEILPGRTGVDRSVCVDPDLEARLESGAVVASRAGPFCQGDPEWVITQAEVDVAK